MLRILMARDGVRAAAGRGVGIVIGTARVTVAAAVGIANCLTASAGPLPGTSSTLAKADVSIDVVRGPRQPGCTKRSGRGFAPTDHFARLKAWETVAQATGNWPIQTDEFRTTTYRCRTERNGRLCLVAIEVCRRG